MSDRSREESRAQAGLVEAMQRLAGRDHGDLADRLARLLTVVAEEAVTRPSFARELAKVLIDQPATCVGGKARRSRSRSLRRPAGVLDPFDVYKEGESVLRRRLEDLDIEQLKDIIAEHGMDRDKLAMKWKTSSRLIERIVETVKARASKGDVFHD